MKFLRFEHKIAFAYLLIGFLWIAFSDSILHYIVHNPQLLKDLQTYKGWFYVLITTVAFFYFLKAHLSKHRKLEESLLLSERKLHAVLNHHYQLTGLLDTQGRLHMANQKAAEFAGISKEEVIGKYIWDGPWWNDQQRQEIKDAFNRAVKGEFVRLDTYHTTPEGEKKNFDFSFNPVKNNEDEVIYVVPEGRDITEMLKVEKSLRESEERFRNVFSKATDGIVIHSFDLQQGISHCNEAAYKILGYNSADDLIGKTIPEVSAEYQASGEKSAILADFYIQECKNKGLAKFEWIFQQKDKTQIYFEIVLTKISFGGHDYVHSVWRDISKRKRIELDLIGAKEKAEESDRLKTAFLLNMSHEIRTPMNGVLGFINLLDQPDLSPEERSQFIHIINKSGDRLVDTIDDILEISKIEIGDIQLDIKEVDTTELMLYYRDFFKIQIHENGLNFKISEQINGDAAIIKTDKAKIDGIMENLIKNAIKFTEKGSIEIGNYLNDDYLWFYVSDTGKGIPEEKFDIIFDRFVQADLNLNRGYEGAGIGLSIVKAYVEALGGQVQLESEPGRGSIFRFSIPYRPVNKRILSPAVKPVIKSEAVESTILIVEDEEINYKLLDKVFNAEYKLLFAYNGAEALKLYEDHPEIELILMDMKMPGDIDGIKATQLIRQNNPQIPIIAMTAFVMSNDRERFLNAGCSDFIAKPFRLKQIKKLVRESLLN